MQKKLCSVDVYDLLTTIYKKSLEPLVVAAPGLFRPLEPIRRKYRQICGPASI